MANPDLSVAVDGTSFTRDDDWLMAAVRNTIGAETASIAAASLTAPTDIGFLNHEYIGSYLTQGGARESILAKFPAVKSRLQAQSPSQSARIIQQESGGQGTTKREFSLGNTAGAFKVTYEMYSIPDHLDIIYRGTTVASTGGLVSGSATLTFNYQPVGKDTTVSIVVTAPNSGTAWDYVAYCPSASWA